MIFTNSTCFRESKSTKFMQSNIPLQALIVIAAILKILKCDSNMGL